jgi:hypothetical protein
MATAPEVVLAFATSSIVPEFVPVSLVVALSTVFVRPRFTIPPTPLPARATVAVAARAPTSAATTAVRM